MRDEDIERSACTNLASILPLLPAVKRAEHHRAERSLPSAHPQERARAVRHLRQPRRGKALAADAARELEELKATGTMRH
jgi:hypothetical protein